MLLQSEHDVYTLASRAACLLTLTTLKQLPRYAQLKMLCVQAGQTLARRFRLFYIRRWESLMQCSILAVFARWGRIP